MLVLIAACLLAQAPIGMGPAGLVDVFDWASGTGAGCTAGPRGTCTGGGLSGDTWYFTGWMADGTIVGSFNDGIGKTCSGNLALLKLTAFSWTNRNASRVEEINCMADYNPGSNAPAGWFGHCISGDDAASGNVCGWKSRTPFALDGKLYLPVERQIGSGSAAAHDSTMIVSADGGLTWRNPYTVAHAGAASATGDAPLCGAANGNAGSNCLDTKYSGAIMWPGMPTAGQNGIALYNWLFFQYGQDGAIPAGVGGDCDPATYVCLMLDDASVARVLRSDLPSLDVTKWQYVAGLDARYKPTWTSTFANRKAVGPIISGNDTEIGRPRQFVSGPVYLKEFRSYVLLGGTWGPAALYWMVSPGPFGPWKTVGYQPNFHAGFATVALGIGYTVISTNPPHVQVTQPYGNGDVPSYTDAGRGRINSGWQFTAGDVPGTFNRNGLVWAFDFMDHGGIANGYPYFHDVANNSAVLYPCFTDGGTSCGYMVKGASLLSNGVQLQAGYSARLESNVAENNTGASGGNQNAPGAMQGNGSYTVAGVFRYDSGQYDDMTPLWSTGDSSGDNTLVGLYYKANTANNLTLSWIGRAFVAPSFTMTTGSWYFIAATVQANGSTPAAHIWTGASGTLTDIIAGVSRSGTGTATPNVSAFPLRMMPTRGSVSYAGLMVYNRALSPLDCAALYQGFKAKMAERRVTVQ
jgi:hypothetical protein